MYYVVSRVKFGGGIFEVSFGGECAVQCYTYVFGVRIVIQSISIELYVYLGSSKFVIEVEAGIFCFVGIGLQSPVTEVVTQCGEIVCEYPSVSLSSLCCVTNVTYDGYVISIREFNGASRREVSYIDVE